MRQCSLPEHWRFCWWCGCYMSCFFIALPITVRRANSNRRDLAHTGLTNTGTTLPLAHHGINLKEDKPLFYREITFLTESNSPSARHPVDLVGNRTLMSSRGPWRIITDNKGESSVVTRPCSPEDKNAFSTMKPTQRHCPWTKMFSSKGNVKLFAYSGHTALLTVPWHPDNCP